MGTRSRSLARLAFALLAAGALPPPSADTCPGAATLLEEARTAARLGAALVKDGKPELARTLLQATAERLDACVPDRPGVECAPSLARARDDVALAYSLHARRQDGPLREVLQRAAASLLAYSGRLDLAERGAVQDLHQRITTGFSAPSEELASRDVLLWWDQLEGWCLAEPGTQPVGSGSSARGSSSTKHAP